MLPVYSTEIAKNGVIIKKQYDGKAADTLGAFPCGAKVVFTAQVPRTLGTCAVVMRIARDNGAYGEERVDPSYRDLPFEFTSTNWIYDIYTLTINTADLCGGDGSGLFYYEYLFLRGADTLFSDTYDNLNFNLSSKEGRFFRLLVYEKGFKTPSWLGGGVMYQIFPDRFCRGKGRTKYAPDAERVKKWNGVEVQHAHFRGEAVKNNQFFGGNLWGIIEKLPYLASLGVSVIYLNPIFAAKSNHKYDTADYMKVDDGFGGDNAFKKLVDAAHAAGIKVVLDGVFNHTGDESTYFDAARANDEKYRDWYYFHEDGGYESWWGISILPKLRLSNPDCRDYFTGEGGVIEKYLLAGADGWRLDVADELPDEFLFELRERARAVNKDAVVIGEVWENAAEKVAYSKRRSYFRGKQLDSVMNYPLRVALIDYATNRNSAHLANTLTELYASYPPQVSNVLMNIIGTHDTERILSLLGDRAAVEIARHEQDNDKLAAMRLSDEGRAWGKKLLTVTSVIQYTVFGFPCVYYGDELGMEGMGDPFCRRPMAWDFGDEELLAHYRTLGEMRKSEGVFDGGDFRVTRADGGYFEFVRTKGKSCIKVAANLSCDAQSCKMDGAWTDIYNKKRGKGDLALGVGEFCVLKYRGQ